MKRYQVKIKTIKLGLIPSGGGLATSFEVLGEVLKGSLTIEETEPTEEKVFVYGKKSPALIFTTEEPTTKFKWKQFGWSEEALVALWGGNTVNGQWQEPLGSTPKVERAVRVELEDGDPFIIPRAKITAVKENDGDKLVIAITAEKLQPEGGISGLLIGDQITSEGGSGE
jgi:hypothetical protein